MTDEKLIEEAAKAIADEAGVLPSERYEEMWQLARRDAEAAFKVFEKAHTPTDDEPIAYAVYGRETGRLKYVQTIETLDEVDEVAQFYEVVPLFRRTVRGEPTDAQVNAEVVQAALSNILSGLMDRDSMPAVRLSNTKTRVVRLMNQIDGQAINHENTKETP